MAFSRGQRALAGVCIAVVLVVLLDGCQPVRDATFYADMKAAFPTFRVIRADYSEAGGGFGEGGGTYYDFDLESDEVAGFHLVGTYYGAEGKYQMPLLTSTIFSGKVLGNEDVIEFERLWVSLALPPVYIGKNKQTGPSRVPLRLVAEQYRNYPQRYVYQFDTGQGALYYFVLDPSAHRWRQLPDYERK